jgi:hypothetical protein
MGEFEEGQCWAQYNYMEDEFLQFLVYVPYMKCRTNVFSPRLAEMLLEICGYIDSILKLMAGYEAFKSNSSIQELIAPKTARKRGARYACGIFDRIYGLSTNNDSQVIAKLAWHGPKEMKPFASFKTWWNAYNNIKHSWSSSTIDQANMDNVLNSLAGAFLLNAVHVPSIEMFYKIGELKPFSVLHGGRISTEHDYSLDQELFTELIEETKKAAMMAKPVFLNWNHLIDTRLFTYRHLKKKEEKS